jgi:hypothetical protein
MSVGRAAWIKFAIERDFLKLSQNQNLCPLFVPREQRISTTARCRTGVYFALRHPHILPMATWQRTPPREPPKTKAELREMLTEAVRNTQSEAKRRPKEKKDRG